MENSLPLVISAAHQGSAGTEADDMCCRRSLTPLRGRLEWCSMLQEHMGSMDMSSPIWEKSTNTCTRKC